MVDDTRAVGLVCVIDADFIRAVGVVYAIDATGYLYPHCSERLVKFMVTTAPNPVGQINRPSEKVGESPAWRRIRP